VDTTSELSEAAISQKITDAVDDCIRQNLDQVIKKVVDHKVDSQLVAHIDQSVAKQFDEKVAKSIEHKAVFNIESIFEDRVIFGARWIIAPSYGVLALALLVLCYKSMEEFVELVIKLRSFNSSQTLIQALSIVDVILVMNLILMIMFVGYTNFVSKIHPARAEDWPEWTQHLDYSGLKIQLLGSIIAISSLVLLQELLETTEQGKLDSNQVLLSIAIQMAFVLSALVLAAVNFLKERASQLQVIAKRSSEKFSDQMVPTPRTPDARLPESNPPVVRPVVP
jgi:uncharacterized protein (TIGR00645 family)